MRWGGLPALPMTTFFCVFSYQKFVNGEVRGARKRSERGGKEEGGEKEERYLLGLARRPLHGAQELSLYFFFACNVCEKKGTKRKMRRERRFNTLESKPQSQSSVDPPLSGTSCPQSKCFGKGRE